MTTLDKIKAEIQKVLDKERDFTSENAKAQAMALMWCLEIIDKYASEECDRDCEHCAYIECPKDDYQTDMDEIAEIMKCDADAETKRKMISNILTAKPHYFAEKEPKSCKKCLYAEETDGSHCYECVKGESKFEQEPCEDAVSRQAVLDIIEFEDKWLLDAKGHNKDTEIVFSGLKTKITDMPSVQPKAKTGRWISREGGGQVLPFWGKYQCSECGECAENNNFCPNCGAEMVGDTDANSN